MSRISRIARQEGQTSAEYLGMVAFVVAVATILIASGQGIGGTVRDKILAFINGDVAAGIPPIDGGPIAGPGGPLPRSTTTAPTFPTARPTARGPVIMAQTPQDLNPTP